MIIRFKNDTLIVKKRRKDESFVEISFSYITYYVFGERVDEIIANMKPKTRTVGNLFYLLDVLDRFVEQAKLLCKGCYEDPCECLPDDCDCDPN